MTRRPALLLVAHGSRDPRSAATVRHLAGAVRARAGGVEVRAAFLDLSVPSTAEALDQLHADGHHEVTVVPLLLGSAYHARVDLPAIVAEVTTRLPRLHVTVADILGPDPAVRAVALDLLVAAGADPADPGLGVVLAAVGSSHASANAVVHDLARDWQDHNACLVTPGFVGGAHPDVAGALAELRDRGVRRFAVASWFLAPGLLPDRVGARARQFEPGVLLAEPLGADPRVAAVVLQRYHAARTTAMAPGIDGAA